MHGLCSGSYCFLLTYTITVKIKELEEPFSLSEL